ncbi:TetR/AcrR family transcriptional regulator [Thalassotalea sediminis]|uniref:TetR/AcrR family transcriptional regulator n=1 Tax=Thalassotalea sediminis TaxID=1759089 RepID=UPI002573DD89|nr:TetR/AcrR family transcriptional regulator [Thalassotalea sediminis]
MPWDSNHKNITKQRILIAAAKLFTQQSFDDISIDDVMKEAALTRGAFYSHFKSKADLYQQSIAVAAQQAYQNIMSGCGDSATEIRNRYLQQTFLENNDVLCPIASLVSDIRHRDPKIRDTYTQVFGGFVQNMIGFTQDEQKAFQQAAMLIGAVALSQTLNDEQLKQKLLDACMQENTLSD